MFLWEITFPFAISCPSPSLMYTHINLHLCHQRTPTKQHCTITVSAITSSIDDNYYPTKSSFSDRLIDQSTRHTFKKPKYSYNFNSDMAFFTSASTQHLVLASTPICRWSEHYPQSHNEISMTSFHCTSSFPHLSSPTSLSRLSANGSSKPQSRPHASTSAGSHFSPAPTSPPFPHWSQRVLPIRMQRTLIRSVTIHS